MQIGDKLRSVTRSIHLQLHAHPLLCLLTSPNISTQDLLYIQQAQYGYWQPLLSAGDTAMPSSPIVQWLSNDLLASGVDPLQLSLCQDLPPLTNEEQLLGLTYVKEGSLLGGQVIYKHISQSIPESMQVLSFFKGRGKETPLHWRAFLQYLEQRSSKLNHDLICESAVNTFLCFKQWMDNCYDKRAEFKPL